MGTNNSTQRKSLVAVNFVAFIIIVSGFLGTDDYALAMIDEQLMTE